MDDPFIKQENARVAVGARFGLSIDLDSVIDL